MLDTENTDRLIQHASKLQTIKRRPSPLVPRRERTRDRAGKQKALIQAALGLFATKGYEATTTREIAAAAGCAEGLIHRYFRGKAGLLPALVHDHISNEVEEMGQRLRPLPTLEKEFLQLVAWEMERMWLSRDFLRVFIPRAMVDPALARVMNEAVLSARIKAITGRLRRYRPCAALPPDELEAVAQAVGVFGLIFGFMRPMVLGQDRPRARQMGTTLAKVLIRGLYLAKADHNLESI